MDLSEKILMLRKKNNLSQEQLAEKLSVSRQAVSKWESQQAMPDIDKIINISEIFGVSTDYLLKDEVDKEANPVETNPYIRAYSHPKCMENTTTSSILSLVFGIVSIVLVIFGGVLAIPPAVAGLIFGLIGLREIKNNGGRRGKGYALVGIGCSTVTLMIVVFVLFIFILRASVK